MRDTLLVVGNGMAIDLRAALHPALDGWNTSSPIQWDLVHPRYQKELWTLFPHAVAALRTAQEGTDFERMQAILREIPKNEFPYVEVELRHYLVMAFSMYQLAVDRVDLSAWRWTRFITDIAARLRGVVSLNYDTTAEDLVRKTGQRTYFPGVQLTEWERRIEQYRSRPSVAVIKPHGSVDFRAGDGTIAISVEYPLQNWLSDNDLWLNKCYRQHWLDPRVAADVVIPTEISRFRDFQWARPQQEWIRSNAAKVQECYVIGFSYADCDRPDVDAVFERLPKGARIVIADPFPAKALVEKLEGAGHQPEIWESAPPA